MSRRALLQYLELLKQSGIRQLYHEPAGAQAALDKKALLKSLALKYSDCDKCPLAAGRLNLVYGEGNENSIAMFIGEGPGDNENKIGKPFVGAAGQLLDKMLAAINITRQDIYITNIVKCRPPENRNPSTEERLACLPYLVEQIQIIQPKILFIMGLVAAQSLLGNTNTLTWHRQSCHEFMGIPAFVSYHPAALLRNSNWKRPAWEDLQAFQKEYEKLL
ncbi:MAG: uracil-DNA glycosylase [Candidatus Cloacimonetes bacterium]|jgi:DNA polymerase|nr:uracil-DNA glycosylase [Candidatus Cloacimonadota bacterium]MCB5287069.1 uracil-DNA glycosylase [Candidatus Cloacimonadota bacterium]MCK9184536.1 uracil-DNA glycosylase [Candidatus Cloacimonadota bacterium]MCK9584212.1 uracil-DNA glycosylase [Candidatus Cloacimonadota bacterium]MDY0229389.1 uracil-DNA glycosylase [Candidatus Cloacimonadaceae bacterium]